MSFLKILKVQLPSKNSENYSQGLLFVVVSCQKVCRRVQKHSRSQAKQTLTTHSTPLIRVVKVHPLKQTTLQKRDGLARATCFKAFWARPLD